MFKKSKKGFENFSFEVVRIKQVKATMLFGVLIEAHEAMPSNEQWGESGWSYRDKSEARKRFDSLVTASKTPRISHKDVNRGINTVSSTETTAT